MVQLIAFIIFSISLLGIAFILLKKIPELVTLPKNGHHGIKKHKVIIKAEKRIKDLHFHFFSKQMLLHKLLSKFRLLVLKTEKKVDSILHSIRKKAQELDKQVKKKK